MSDSTKKYVLAIDAGGTFFKSGIVDNCGEVFPDSLYSARANSDKDAESVKAAYTDIIHTAFAFAKQHDIELCGIAVDTPGPFDFENGISLMEHKFRAIYGIPLKPWFYEAAGCEIPVTFIHDSAAFIMGELWDERFNGVKNAAGVMLGTGLGFALYKDGKLCVTEKGTPEVSIYASPFEDGIAEDYISRRGINSIYRKLMSKNNLTVDIAVDAKEIGDLADHGDKIAHDAYAFMAKCLAKVLKPIFDKYEPEILVLGGQISKSFNHMEDELKAGLSSCKSLKLISVSDRIENGHMLGAAHSFFMKHGAKYE